VAPKVRTTTIANNLKAIATEAQKNAAGATSGPQAGGPLARLRPRLRGSH
jgi:hypothetical protein